MLGVLKRRWKPKRNAKSNNSIHKSTLVANYNLYSEPVLSVDAAQFEKIISPSSRQSLAICEDSGTDAYETIKLPSPMAAPSALIGGNICVADGRIEFAKEPPDGGRHSYSISSHVRCGHEKTDIAKECLEARIMELEKALDAERKLVQREKSSVARLQRQLSRREVIQRDVDRERRLRLEAESRLRNSESDTERCRAKLAILQREFIRMEDTVRSMLQYKTKYEQLKQDKTSLTIACENHIQHFQNIIRKVKEENEELKLQLQSFNHSSETNNEVQGVLLERIEILQNQNSKLMQDGDSQRKQYEKCLDDVANQVVKALLTQKNLQEEVDRLQHRVKELETCNNGLSSLLVQRFKGNTVSHPQESSSSSTASSCLHSSPKKFDNFYNKMESQRPISLDELRLSNVWDRSRAASTDLVLLPIRRPHSLNLESSSVYALDRIKKEVEDESPESGNRDEGYSTMSSDVQGTTEMPRTAMEQLKEANESDLDGSSKMIRTVTCDQNEYNVIRFSSSLNLDRYRDSFPPFRQLLPYHHIIRSLSDSQLCLRISARLVKSKLPKLHAKVSSLIEMEDTEDGLSFCSSDLFDNEYVQQWLHLDERRSQVRQLQMEYDAAEVEDWSMEENDHRRKRQRSNSNKTQPDNPQITLCDWDSNNEIRTAWNDEDNQNSLSSDWSSSAGTSEENCSSPFDNLSKRSSTVYSGSDTGDGVQVGTEFTRDFYRLVKFESSKSLASSSTKSQNEERLVIDENAVDREQALQSVLKFIAEQQRYCISRLVDEQSECKAEQSTNPFERCDSGPKVNKFNPFLDLDESNVVAEPKMHEAVCTTASAVNALLFSTCDNCFRSMDSPFDGNVCDNCKFIDLLPETEYEARHKCLEPVPEESEDAGEKDDPVPSIVFSSPDDNPLSFHENATSKEVIDELNRMIKKDEQDRLTPVTDLDDTFGCSTSWVHVEQDIDFSDPNTRANLLDAMLASSSSSSAASSCNNSESDDEEMQYDKDYRHLHRLHRFRRHKRASACRDSVMGPLRFSNWNFRPSIIGRNNDFYNRYGEQERAAVASFDFLEELSTTSLSTASEPDTNVKKDENKTVSECSSCSCASCSCSD